MALSLVLTGTNQTISVTAGSPNVTFASGVAANWVVGATVQGMSWPTGTKIISITGTPATATAAVLSVNYPSTTGSGTVIVSSNNATAIFNLGASGDTATPQNIINLGLGLMPTGTNNTIQIFGRTYIEFRFVQGSTYDDSEWTYFLGLYSYIRVNETYTGTWRSGYKLQGSTYIKAKGATIYYQQARAVQGGTSIGTNSGAPAGFPTNKLKLHWHDVVWIGMSGSNYAMSPQLFYGEWYQCGDIVFDYWGDSGANASFQGSYGSIEKLSMFKVIGGISGGFDTTTVTPIGKLEWFCIPNGDTTGNNPDIKLGTPTNVPVSGIAPIFYQTNTSLTFIGVNSTATEIWDDYVLPTDYPLLTNSRNYSNGNRTYRRTVAFTIKDSNASALTNTTVYVKSGSNELYNAVSSGNFSQKLRTIWVDWTTRSPSSGSYIAPIQTIDNRIHTAQLRKYGYQQQSVTYTLTNDAYSQPFFLLTDASLNGISEATASAITTAGINWSTKTITPTADLTYDQINARIAYELAQTANSAQADPRTINGSNLTLASGWSLVVNTGRTILAGTNITYLYVPTITLNGTGKITAVYATTAGTSTVLELNTPSDGYSLCIFKADGTTKYFASNVNTGSYYVYFAPSEAGTYYLGAENYGQKRTADTLVLSGGNVWYNITDQEDVGITDSKATASAYTTLSTTSQIYDATAYFRLSETGIKLGQLCTRDGLYLDFGTYNVKIKDDASAIVAVSSGTITYKSIVVNETTKYTAMKATPPATITPTDTEIINVLIEDANGDSQVKIEGGSGTYQIWKLPNSTPNIDFQTGTLLTTTNSLTYRFIGEDGFKLFLYDTGTLYGDSVSKSKGNYLVALFFGPQVQLAQSAEVTLINQIVNELKLKLDTNLDEKVSTRLAGVDYIDPATAQEVWEYTTRTLTSAGASGATLAEIEASTILAMKADVQAVETKVDTKPTLAEIEASEVLAKQYLLNQVYSIANSTDATVNDLAGNDFDSMNDSLDAISAKVDLKPSLSDIENSTILAKETSVQDVKTKVDTLTNYDDATAQSKLDDIKAKTDTLENTDLTGIEEDLTIINNGVKKASLIIPHNQNL